MTDMGQCNPDRLHFADADASGRILAEYVYSASGNPVVKKIDGNITNVFTESKTEIPTDPKQKSYEMFKAHISCHRYR